MGKKSGPKAPDPVATANAQSQANKEAVTESARVNRFDSFSPFGSVTWNKPSADPSTWSQNTQLSEAGQAQLDQQNQLAELLGQAGITKAGQLPMDKFSLQGIPELSTDFSGDASRVEQATFDRAMGLLSPQFQEQERRLTTSLANQGIPVSSEAYGTEMDRFGRNRDEFQLKAALDAVGAGRQEQSRMFGMNQAARQQGISDALTERTQGMNELAAILQGSPALGTPNVPQTAQYQMAPPDIAGLIQGNYQTKANQHGAMKGGLTGLAGTLGGAAIRASDARLKTNITPVGEMNGHRWYSWRWNEEGEKLGLKGQSFGVIADEVEQYAPELVTERNGYKAVDYRGLLNG